MGFDPIQNALCEEHANAVKPQVIDLDKFPELLNAMFALYAQGGGTLFKEGDFGFWDSLNTKNPIAVHFTAPLGDVIVEVTTQNAVKVFARGFNGWGQFSFSFNNYNVVSYYRVNVAFNREFNTDDGAEAIRVHVNVETLAT